MITDEATLIDPDSLAREDRLLYQRAERNLPMIRAKVCKNNTWSIVRNEEKTDWVVQSKGCNQLRRPGSAYCQKCSDEFNNNLI